MDGQDLDSLGWARQVHEEKLVEAPTPQQLGWETRDVVGRRDDKDRRLFLGEPGEECTEDACGPRICGRGREAFLDFVNPEDCGCKGFSDRDSLSDRRFDAALSTAKRGGEVESEQRKLPLACNRLGAEGLAAALNA